MAKYKPLGFMEMLELLEVSDNQTGEVGILKDSLEKNYNEILEFNKNTTLSGELTLKLKV